MSAMTSQGYWSQRRQLSFARQLNVQCGDDPAIAFRFRPSEFFTKADEAGLLPDGWKKIDGRYEIRTRNTEMPSVPKEEDSNGKRITELGYTIRVPVADFPENIPENEWLDCEVIYQTSDRSVPSTFFVQGRPMVDRGQRLTMYIADRNAVYDDSPGAGRGHDHRNYKPRR